MRRFAILFDKFPIDKQSVKAGRNSEEVVMACRCINVGLFISGNLRRDVTVSILISNESNVGTMISFVGSTLRRVSPDERSISFFLLKAVDAAGTMEAGQQKVLDNGVVVEKISMKTLMDQWSSGILYTASQDVGEWPRSRIRHDDGIFLYAHGAKIAVGQVLPAFSSPERFILEVNLLADRAVEDS